MPLYEGQPRFGEIEQAMRVRGFVPPLYRYADNIHRSGGFQQRPLSGAQPSAGPIVFS